jgi:hydroxymethylpyrimidine pyrophosphatase-like HAD family hydrolase
MDLPFCLARPGELFLLAADIDGTMLGDRLGEAWLKAFRLDAAGSPAGGFLLVYVTGRDFRSVMELVDEGQLPYPNFICSEVGTEIYDLSDPQNIIGEKYTTQVGPSWDPETIYAMGEGDGIRRQAPPDGPPRLPAVRFQAGFDWDGQPHTLEAFFHRIADLKFCQILPSHGQYIDVLPDVLGKGKAVEFLQKELSLDPERVVVAGDSGNDRQMFETKFKGIVPANALDELKAVTHQPWHYHSPLPAGRGVLEGLCHFGFLIERA